MRSVSKKAPVALQLGDLGHSRGSNKAATNHYFNNQAAKFFAANLLGAKKGKPAPGAVTAFTQTCPLAAPDGGPYKAKGWKALSRGHFSLRSVDVQEFTSAGGDPAVAKAFDPVFGTTEACKTIPVTAEANTGSVSRRVKQGFTMLGLPTVSAKILTTGQYGQIDARLWDISPEGTQLLVSRGTYALENGQRGTIEFQLHGNGYRFAKGHTVQLQVLGRDAPYYQPGSVPFTVRTENLTVALADAAARTEVVRGRTGWDSPAQQLGRLRRVPPGPPAALARPVRGAPGGFNCLASSRGRPWGRSRAVWRTADAGS